MRVPMPIVYFFIHAFLLEKLDCNDSYRADGFLNWEAHGEGPEHETWCFYNENSDAQTKEMSFGLNS